MTVQPTHSAGTLIDGVKTVADTGTPEALSSSVGLVHVVDIQAHSSNTAPVTIGASTVVHGTTAQRGIKLNAGDSWTFYDVDLSTVYVDVGVNGEGVGFTASKR